MIMAINILKAPHVGVRELKEKLSAFLKGDKPLVVTDHGAPTNVILPYDDVLELLDILDELNDSETRDIVREGRSAIRSGSEGIPVFPHSKKVSAKRK